MRYLRQNTDQYVSIGMVLDKTAGFGNEDALTVTSFSGVLVKSTQSGASTHTPFTPDATASNDWGMAAIGHGGLYDLKIPDSEINFVGSCMLAVWYDAEALPVWHEFVVLPANVYDSLMGTDLLDVNQAQILGTALTETSAGYLAAAFKKFFDKATPTGTINSLPDAVAGANGGLPTQNGTKLNQTVDLTAGQSIACSDKAGFSLSATGADLILKNSTFIQAIVVAIKEYATYGLEALNTLLVSTGIKAASVPNVTLAATQASYAPAKAGDKMDLIDAPNATALLAVANKVEAEIIDETDSEKVLTAITNKIAAVNPDLSGLTLLAIASAVRTNLAAELANIDAKISTRSSHSAADVKTAIEAAGSSIASILADTNEVQGELANGGRLDLLIDAILEDTGTTLPASLTSIVSTIAAIGVGTAPVAHLYTVTTTGGVYCADCLVIMSTDSAMANPIHKGTTDELGQVTFYPNLPAGTTVYLWKFKSGVNFVNPTTEVIHS